MPPHAEPSDLKHDDSASEAMALAQRLKILRKASLGHECATGTALDCEPRSRNQPGGPSDIYTIIPGKLSFAVHPNESFTSMMIQKFPKLFFFSSCLHEAYEPFCSDFGPVNLGIVYRFLDFMRGKFKHPKLQQRHMVYYIEDREEHKANAAFLLSTFLVLELGWSPEEAVKSFTTINPLPFRDATYTPSDFDLSILDCLKGLCRARSDGFFDVQTFDLEEYEFWDDPEMADMHQICPKFWAFRGPVDSNEHLARSYDFVDVFHKIGVTAVVQLNEEDGYDPSNFTKGGINHHKLDFEDCTPPPFRRVQEFLEICEKEQGAVAVHCKAGLGRTGTMIAIYLMKHHGWTARECIGWLRIARPGSVIGPQQQFLVEWEALGMEQENARKLYAKTFISPERAKLLASQVTKALSVKSMSYSPTVTT